MWKHVASEIQEELNVKFTFLQMENRYKSVCKKKKQLLTTIEVWAHLVWMISMKTSRMRSPKMMTEYYLKFFVVQNQW